ncbi:MAG: hypothetical protein JWM72_2882 [Actinomycetia bacterium]|nr:hypothetical protein [Actinomycetes bacterium]
MWSTQFEWDGLTGNLEVECIPNDDPAGYGTVGSDAYGFPVCTATVEYPRRGYRSMFGWVQLVRSTDNESRGEQFEVDPFALFGDARSPYCWYGTEPTLFDAPSRLQREPLTWLSHSFLATTPLSEVLAGNPRRVVPIAGFSWGFDVCEDDSVVLREVAPLAAADWETVVPVLRAEYPSPLWTFADSL